MAGTSSSRGWLAWHSCSTGLSIHKQPGTITSWPGTAVAGRLSMVSLALLQGSSRLAWHYPGTGMFTADLALLWHGVVLRGPATNLVQNCAHTGSEGQEAVAGLCNWCQLA